MQDLIKTVKEGDMTNFQVYSTFLNTKFTFYLLYISVIKLMKLKLKMPSENLLTLTLYSSNSTRYSPN